MFYIELLEVRLLFYWCAYRKSLNGLILFLYPTLFLQYFSSTQPKAGQIFLLPLIFSSAPTPVINSDQSLIKVIFMYVCILLCLHNYIVQDFDEFSGVLRIHIDNSLVKQCERRPAFHIFLITSWSRAFWRTRDAVQPPPPLFDQAHELIFFRDELEFQKNVKGSQ